MDNISSGCFVCQSPRFTNQFETVKELFGDTRTNDSLNLSLRNLHMQCGKDTKGTYLKVKIQIINCKETYGNINSTKEHPS